MVVHVVRALMGKSRNKWLRYHHVVLWLGRETASRYLLVSISEFPDNTCRTGVWQKLPGSLRSCHDSPRFPEHPSDIVARPSFVFILVVQKPEGIHLGRSFCSDDSMPDDVVS